MQGISVRKAGKAFTTTPEIVDALAFQLAQITDVLCEVGGNFRCTV